MIFESSEKFLSRLPNVNKPHKLTNFFGMNWLLKKVHSIPQQDILYFRLGATFVMGISSVLAYYYYRRNIQSEFQTGKGFSRILESKPIDAGNQFYQNFVQNKMTFSGSFYTRIQETEFDVYYSLRKSFLTGYFDHTKEILIPAKKNGQEGYNVITPFYYYYMIRPDTFFTQKVDGKPVSQLTTERAAMVVNRGWYLFLLLLGSQLH
jgi:hypothetical protein